MHRYVPFQGGLTLAVNLPAARFLFSRVVRYLDISKYSGSIYLEFLRILANLRERSTYFRGCPIPVRVAYLHFSLGFPNETHPSYRSRSSSAKYSIALQKHKGSWCKTPFVRYFRLSTRSRCSFPMSQNPHFLAQRSSLKPCDASSEAKGNGASFTKLSTALPRVAIAQ